MPALSSSSASLSVPHYPVGCCPRCEDMGVVRLAQTGDSSFVWHECTRCAHLWATPNGWTPESEFVRAGIE
jgi:hypothetical protein